MFQLQVSPVFGDENPIQKAKYPPVKTLCPICRKKLKVTLTKMWKPSTKGALNSFGPTFLSIFVGGSVFNRESTGLPFDEKATEQLRESLVARPRKAMYRGHFDLDTPRANYELRLQCIVLL
jgi:hypothetical protein